MEEEKYKVELTKEQIAILKAGLEYFLDIEAFSCQFSRLHIFIDSFYTFGWDYEVANVLRESLNVICPIEPNFGYLTSIGGMSVLRKVLGQCYKSEKRKVNVEIRRQKMTRKK